MNVPDRVEELVGLADASVDGLGRDGEEAGDGDLREPEPLIEEGGQESVDQGEAGASAGIEAGGGSLLPVAAASLVKIFFALGLPGRRQLADALVPPFVVHAGQDWVDQPCAAGTGLELGRDRGIPSRRCSSGRRV